MRVGYTDDHHNTRKQFLCHTYGDITFTRVVDTTKILQVIGRKIGISSLSIKGRDCLRGAFHYPRVDVMHYWGAVSATAVPWITSTSTGIPFGISADSPSYSAVVQLLAGNACHRIICTSEVALGKQRRKIERFGSLSEAILRKTILLPPPQAPVTAPSNKNYTAAAIEFAFVGGDFCRKGGCEVVNAFRRLSDSGVTARLRLITNPDQLRSAAPMPQLGRAVEAIANCSAIEFLGIVRPEAVIDFLSQSHVLLLPSYSETYGYTVLEAQACGCPVVTSGVGAFPEINADQVGWRVVTDPLNRIRTPSSDPDGIEQSLSLENQLFELMRRIVDSRREISEKAERAFQVILAKHDPARHKSLLREIYLECLSK